MEKAAADPTSTATASGHEDLTPLVPYAAEIEYVTVKQATRRRADLLRIPSRSRMSLPTAMFPASKFIEEPSQLVARTE
jgi:hypothetical protein